MNSIVIQKESINVTALDETLRAALGSAVSGFSFSNGQVTVHLNDEATPQQIQQAQQIVTSHDPLVLTPEQQAEVDRQQTLEQARQAATAVTLNLGDYNGAAQQTLAKKVLWLEQAVLDLQQRFGVQ